MQAPQSRDEVEPVIRALQRMDGLLDVIWNPQAKMTSRGAYSVTGKLTPPTYEGRWQVIRYQTEHTNSRRDYALICTVTAPIDVDGIRCLQADGPYAPVGEWLVALMQSADAANVRTFTALRERLWAQDEKIEHEHDAAEEAMALESLDHVHFKGVYAGGVGNWMGRGANFTPQEQHVGTE